MLSVFLTDNCVYVPASRAFSAVEITQTGLPWETYCWLFLTRMAAAITSRMRQSGKIIGRPLFEMPFDFCYKHLTINGYMNMRQQYATLQAICKYILSH